MARRFTSNAPSRSLSDLSFSSDFWVDFGQDGTVGGVSPLVVTPRSQSSLPAPSPRTPSLSPALPTAGWGWSQANVEETVGHAAPNITGAHGFDYGVAAMASSGAVAAAIGTGTPQQAAHVLPDTASVLQLSGSKRGRGDHPSPREVQVSVVVNSRPGKKARTRGYHGNTSVVFPVGLSRSRPAAQPHAALSPPPSGQPVKPSQPALPTAVDAPASPSTWQTGAGITGDEHMQRASPVSEGAHQDRRHNHGEPLGVGSPSTPVAAPAPAPALRTFSAPAEAAFPGNADTAAAAAAADRRQQLVQQDLQDHLVKCKANGNYDANAKKAVDAQSVPLQQSLVGTLDQPGLLVALQTTDGRAGLTDVGLLDAPKGVYKWMLYLRAVLYRLRRAVAKTNPLQAILADYDGLHARLEGMGTNHNRAMFLVEHVERLALAARPSEEFALPPTFVNAFAHTATVSACMPIVCQGCNRVQTWRKCRRCSKAHNKALRQQAAAASGQR